MITSTNPPPPLPGCTVLPPMMPPGERRHADHDQGHASNAKGKPARRKTADRFAVVNAFVDFSMPGLSRAESLTWLTLWRDTKRDGTAKTSVADLARRIGANPSTVKRAVAALTEAGLLAMVYWGSLRRGPSAYRVRPLVRETAKPPGR
ncbi:MAG: winged helix-turn-helix transcriptional regulator [Pirellulales bacterium]